MMNARRKLALYLGVFAVVGIGLYTYSRIYNLIAGPTLLLEVPTDGLVTPIARLEVSGTANRIARLELNGRQIFTNRQDQFNETLLLLPGYNILELRARDRFDREVTKTLRVIHQ